MICTHPAAAITDHAIRDYDGDAVRYAWRGACLACQRGIVGITALPAGMPRAGLTATLTNDLMAYLSVSAGGA